MGFRSNYDDDDDYEKDDAYVSESESDDDYDDDKMFKERITYNCNDCNYRWQKAYSSKSKDDDIDAFDDSFYDSENTCPMCGSSEIDRI